MKMKIIFIFICLLLTNMIKAQLLNVSAGTDLTILSGTIFKVDSLTLTPSANFIISNNTFNKSAAVIHTATNPYISRVYQLTNTSNPFSGSVQINYTDGAELNGIPETALTLNIHSGILWSAYPVATRDATNNFVFTNGLSAVNLNELTLANLATPLPLLWLSFTATRQYKKALLQWQTSREQYTRSFTLQHSSNGINWAGIGTLQAAGNSNNTSHYSYVHENPVTGINYYRILQTDLNFRYSYSDSRILRFTTYDEPFVIIGNTVTNDILTVQVNTAASLTFYSNDGKLLWQEQVIPGTKHIDVSHYAKGIYLLKAISTIQKVLIQ
jgi:hypothetical protein